MTSESIITELLERMKTIFFLFKSGSDDILVLEWSVGSRSKDHVWDPSSSTAPFKYRDIKLQSNKLNFSLLALL